MAEAQRLDRAMEAIEQSILPSLSLLLDAAVARSGSGDAARSAELRTVADQLCALTGLVTATLPQGSPESIRA